MKLLITIDTECDNAWARENCFATENAKYLVRFQQLCEKYGFKVTYVTAWEMANDDYFVEFASDAIKRGFCEIGSHPHPWNSPPDHKLTSDDIKYHPYLIEYPENVILEKVKLLTELLQNKFQTDIYSHRAGRWAFNSTYAKILCQLGYKVDCSVTPGVNWPQKTRDQNDTPQPQVDYRHFPTTAYYLDGNDIGKSGNSKLLEIPTTIIDNYNDIQKLAYSLPEMPFRKIIRKLFGKPLEWFRPDTRKGFLKKTAKKKIAIGGDYIMFMLHSSEFMPAGSPTFKTEENIEQLFHNIDSAFQFLKNSGVTGMTCHEYSEQFLLNNS